jgi:hypothetical protein
VVVVTAVVFAPAASVTAVVTIVGAVAELSLLANPIAPPAIPRIVTQALMSILWASSPMTARKHTSPAKVVFGSLNKVVFFIEVLPLGNMGNWFDSENIDAAEFVDNCEEILVKLRAIEKLRFNKISLDNFWNEIGGSQPQQHSPHH